jgi:MinD superfamily P-loop ATPase
MSLPKATKTNRDLNCGNCGALIPAGELFSNTRFVIAVKDGRTHHLDENLCRSCSGCSISGTEEIAVTHWEHDALPMIEWVLDDLDIRFE